MDLFSDLVLKFYTLNGPKKNPWFVQKCYIQISKK